jgi:hypothetical protein
MVRCRDDLQALTRFVTWSLDEGGSAALTRSLPDQTNIIGVYQVALKAAGKDDKAVEEKSENATQAKEPGELIPRPAQLGHLPVGSRHSDRNYRSLIQIMDEALMTRDDGRANVVVGGLVQHIVSGWREQFCKSVTTKFNCYFMLPFVDEFHRFMRKELQRLYDGEDNGLTAVFDLAAVRRSLELHRQQLSDECKANKQLQEKFQLCASQMNT